MKYPLHARHYANCLGQKVSILDVHKRPGWYQREKRDCYTLITDLLGIGELAMLKSSSQRMYLR